MNAEPSGNGRPALSVLVALHQSADHLRTALAALSAQDVADAEFVFCDDASTDGTADMIRPQLEECGLSGGLEEHVADAADAAAVQAFKARFRYYAAMDFSVPDAVFAGYLPETRRLYGGFSSLLRVLFWLCVHGLRPFVRLAWRLRHPMTGYGHG